MLSGSLRPGYDYGDDPVAQYPFPHLGVCFLRCVESAFQPQGNSSDTSSFYLVLDEGPYEKLLRWIISTFPTPATPNMTDTLSIKLLQRLSASLLFAEYPSAADAPPDLHEFWKKVELSLKTLQHLNENSNASRKGQPSSPTNRKRGRTVTGENRIGPLSSGSFGINLPATEAGVHEICVGLLSELQGILEVRNDKFIPNTRFFYFP